MHLQLITLQGVRLDQDIYELIAPTATGEIAIFPGHEHLATLAVPGALAVRHKEHDRDEDLEYFAISGGVVEISPAAIRILVDEADHGDDIVEAESRVALERALKLRDETTDQVEREQAHQLVDRHMVRLRVAELQRHRRR